MMEHIKQEVGEIVGISKAREGQISASSTSGNVQREVVQSSHQTEYYFVEHADVKKRVLITGLETAKIAWGSSKTKKLQFVLSDMATKMITIDMEDVRSIDFDMYISNSREDQELLDNMKQLAHAAIQNDKLTFSELMDIYNSDSLSSIRRKIERGEESKLKRDQDAQQQAERMQTEQLQAAEKTRQEDYQHDIDLETLRGTNAITLEEVKAQFKTLHGGLDVDKDGIRDDVEITKVRMQREAEAIEKDKQRSFEASESEKERANKKELERMKPKKTGN